MLQPFAYTGLKICMLIHSCCWGTNPQMSKMGKDKTKGCYRWCRLYFTTSPMVFFCTLFIYPYRERSVIIQYFRQGKGLLIFHGASRASILFIWTKNCSLAILSFNSKIFGLSGNWSPIYGDTNSHQIMLKRLSKNNCQAISALVLNHTHAGLLNGARNLQIPFISLSSSSPVSIVARPRNWHVNSFATSSRSVIWAIF